MIGTIKGLLGRSAKRAQAKQAKIIGEYNAKVAKIQAKAEADAIDSQSKRLTKQQREFTAQQRMSIAGRGGLERGTDLLSLINSAKTMQLDLLELKRQQDISMIRGETRAQQIKMGAEAEAMRLKAEGTQALLSGIQDDVMMFMPKPS